MFSKKEQLDDILAVFTTTKTKLANFLEAKATEKQELESELASVTSDIDKGTNTLSKLSEIIG